MAQFYFLSILLNVIAGLILFYGKDFTREKLSEEDETLAIDDDKTLIIPSVSILFSLAFLKASKVSAVSPL